MMSSKIPPKSQLSLSLALLVSVALSLVLVASFLVLTVTAAFGIAVAQLYQLSTDAGTTPAALISQGLAGWFKSPTQSNGRKNILILGTDQLANRGEAVVLTDTILIASLDLTTGKLLTLSLPRDLWSEQYQSRINALYALGLERQPAQPLMLIENEVSTLTQIPLHHVVLISLSDVSELVDLVGGVEVDVKESFVDDRFPRSDVDVTTERDPAKLYETVSFEAGRQPLDGARALQFIRSRKSFSAEGSDEARVQRQQQVIQALMTKITQQDPLENRSLLPQLYRFYVQRFSSTLPVTEAISTAKVLLPVAQNLEFSGQSLSIYPQVDQGVIFHPPENTTGGAWLYKVRNLEALQQEVRNKLQLSETKDSS